MLVPSFAVYQDRLTSGGQLKLLDITAIKKNDGTQSIYRTVPFSILLQFLRKSGISF